MSVPLPTYVDIGPLRYSIVVDSERLEREGSNHDLGRCYYLTLEIVMRDGMAEDRQRDVLWHEIQHGCTYLVGIHEHDRLDEEQFIRRVAAVLLAVLRHNPPVAAFLLHGAGPIAPLPGNTV